MCTLLYKQKFPKMWSYCTGKRAIFQEFSCLSREKLPYNKVHLVVGHVGGGALPATGGTTKKRRDTQAILARKREDKAALEDKLTAIEPVNQDSKRKLAGIRKEIRKIKKELLAAETQAGKQKYQEDRK